jgi:hypothetical protein
LHDIWEECGNVRQVIAQIAAATDADDFVGGFAELEIALRHIIWHVRHTSRLREALEPLGLDD